MGVGSKLGHMKSATTHRPLLRNTAVGVLVTDGVTEIWASSFEEGNRLVKAATLVDMSFAVALHNEEQDVEFIEDEDGSDAFARCLEERAAAGTWFGQ